MKVEIELSRANASFMIDAVLWCEKYKRGYNCIQHAFFECLTASGSDHQRKMICQDFWLSTAQFLFESMPVITAQKIADIFEVPIELVMIGEPEDE